MKKFILTTLVIMCLFVPSAISAQTTYYHGPDGGVLTIRQGEDDMLYYSSQDFKNMTPRDFVVITIDLTLKEKLSRSQFIRLYIEFIQVKVPDANENKARKLADELLRQFELYKAEVEANPERYPELVASLKEMAENGGFDYDDTEEEDSTQHSAYTNTFQDLFDWARKHKLTTIRNIGHMRFEDSVTREEAAALFKRSIDAGIFQKPDHMVAGFTFRDANKIAPEFRDSVAYLQKYGIFRGDAHGNFHPKYRISLQEVIIIAMRLHSFDKTLSDAENMKKFTDLTSVSYAESYYAATRYDIFDILKEIFDAR